MGEVVEWVGEVVGWGGRGGEGVGGEGGRLCHITHNYMYVIFTNYNIQRNR